jgi:protein-disulfide isomerase
MSSKSKAADGDRRSRSEQMKAEREAAARAAERRSRLFIALAVIAAVALVAVAVLASRSTSGGNAAVPPGVTAPDGGAPVGDAGAPVVMDEWVDFSCPACKTFHESVGPTVEELVDSGQLQVVYHPLSFLGPGSVLAANAFGCAIEQGKTVEYYDILFATLGAETGPGSFTNEQLIELGAQVGIESEDFATCVNEGRYNGWVANVAASGPANGVTGTPTIFLNGELTEVPNFDPEVFRQLVEEAATAE